MAEVNSINAFFELVGAILAWVSVRQIYKDGQVQGLFWPAQAWSGLWAICGIFYYLAHEDMYSLFFCFWRMCALVCWTLVFLVSTRKSL